jgi:hypothetical protein
MVLMPWRMRKLMLLAALHGACADLPEEEGDVLDDGKADGARAPYGTYRATTVPPGAMTLLVITGYDAQCYKESRACSGSSCPPSFGGSFCRFTRWNQHRFISFYDDVGAFDTRFEYEYSAGMLHLRSTTTGLAFDMKLSPDSYCVDDTWCENQSSGGTCSTGRVCTETSNVCSCSP